MSKTAANSCKSVIANQRGMGLIVAIFVIVIVATFGSLITRYLVTSAVRSAEDYHWSQAVYSAYSAAQVALLFDDGGGSGSLSLSSVDGFTLQTTDIAGGVLGQAQKTVEGTPLSREVEVRLPR